MSAEDGPTHLGFKVVTPKNILETDAVVASFVTLNVITGERIHIEQKSGRPASWASDSMMVFRLKCAGLSRLRKARCATHARLDPAFFAAAELRALLFALVVTVHDDILGLARSRPAVAAHIEALEAATTHLRADGLYRNRPKPVFRYKFETAGPGPPNAHLPDCDPERRISIQNPYSVLPPCPSSCTRQLS